jgi:GNAT superfamily N-acetyltransferase
VAQAFIRVKCNGYLTKNQHDWVGLGKTMRAANFNTRPVTPKRWQDLEAIFNSKGCSMAGVCTTFAKLRRSPVMKAVDDQSVWSIVCFVVPKEHRGKGVASALLNGAIGYAQSQGVTILEAYPVDKSKRSRDDSMFFGPKSMYDAAGFTEVARRRPTRPIVRLTISNQRRCA